MFMLYKIFANGSHLLNRFMVKFIPGGVTRLVVVEYSCICEVLQYHTELFKCLFLNGLVFQSAGL